MRRICSWFLTIVLVLGLCACGQQGGGAGGDDWQSQYDLGVRYLSEGNYEEAVIAFTAAIEIDPNRPEAYVSISAWGTMRALGRSWRTHWNRRRTWKRSGRSWKRWRS